MTSPLDPPFWQTPKLQKSSPRAVARNELLLGRRVEDEAGGEGKAGDLVTLIRELLKEGHVHVRGRTRSGKTSLVLSPMALGLMEDYELTWRESSGKECRATERDCIFVFDLGGDLALFNAVRKKAKSLGRNFRYLSLDPKRSYYFDPFQSVTTDEYRVIRICNLLLEAFSLDHGLVYGGAYYTQRALAALLRVAERAMQSRRAGKTTGLRDIADYLDKHRERDEDAVRMVFQFLLRYEQLMPAASDPFVINVSNAIKNREVIYFFTPTMGEAATARQIAGLGLYTVVNAAMELASNRPPAEWAKPLPHCWVFCDEFHEIAGKSFAALLAGASKFGVSLIMANQTTNQLENRDLSLADIVRDNTLAKVYFTVTGKQDIEELQTFSREDRDVLRSKSASGGGYLEHGVFSADRSGTSEFVVPMLRKDTILDTSATFGQAFVIVDDGKGHKEPIRTQATHALSYEEYRELRSTPLDEVAHVPRPQSEIDGDDLLWQRARRAAPDDERTTRLADLTSLLKAKEDVERLY